MYHTGRNTLRKIHREVEQPDEAVDVVRGERRRRLHKAFLRYHDPANWPLLRDALKAMGRADLIGNGKHHLVPTWQPLDVPANPPRRGATVGEGAGAPGANRPPRGRLLTQHTGLPPREQGRASGKPAAAAPVKASSATRRPAGSPKPGAPRRAR